MLLIVEDGTGLSGSDAYVSADACSSYAAARGLPFDVNDTDAEPAIRRATAYIDATYRARFPGYRAMGRLQALEWPRVGAFTSVPDDGRSAAALYGVGEAYFVQGLDYIPSSQIPREIIAATCEAAIRELAEPGVLAPDLERGGGVASLKAGSVVVRYSGTATPGTVFQAIGLALASLLLPPNPYGGRAARG